MSYKNKHVFLISAVTLLSYNVASNAQSVYRCTNQNGHVTLQDTVCPKRSFQHEMPMPTFGAPGSDALRPFELSSLERLHENYTLRKSYDYENRNNLAQQRVQHENIVDFENLKHKHAIEMFDKNYRHFWVNGYSIGEAPLSIGYGVNNYANETNIPAPANP